MERKNGRLGRVRGVGQRIGPALQALRRREGLTLDELAIRCSISPARIKGIEQGRSDVSLQDLMSLSDALKVDVNYFASYQAAAAQTEAELHEMLAGLDVPQQAMPALLGLSFEAQGALLDGLRWFTLSDLARPVFEPKLLEKVLREGVAASITDLVSGIPKFGLDMEGFCRALTQIEELPGDRLVMSDRLLTVTTPNGGQIDPVDVYRSIFRLPPADPALVRRWAQSLQSAIIDNIQQFESRTVYSRSSIEHYIDTGHWGPGVDVDADFVRKHVGDLVQALRTFPNFRVGLIEQDVPFGTLVKGRAEVLIYIRRDPAPLPDQDPGVAFRWTRPDVIARFRAYYDDLWDQIPAAHKEPGAVADWLERRVASLSR